MFGIFFLLGFTLIPGLIIGLIGLLILVFEVYMFIDVIRNNHLSDTAKVLWAIGILLIHPFVAIGYYFVEYNKH